MLQLTEKRQAKGTKYLSEAKPLKLCSHMYS